MDLTQWQTIKTCARMEEPGKVPVALIVDSPWLPGYRGVSTIDYLAVPEVWLEANLAVIREFPEVIFLPGFWAEYGMAAEPSGFGCKINFYADQPPTINHVISSIDEIGSITTPNPWTDGFMPLVLSIYKNIEPKLEELGQYVKVVAARGPLTIASYVMGVTNFLLAIKMYPTNTHRLLKCTAELTRRWLEAQAGVLSEVEGVMVLDDIVGFLSKDDYLEFAHPYLKSIFASFGNCIKIYHNDMNNAVCYGYMEDLGVNIFNFTHLQDMDKVRKLVGNKVCLMGNVAPVDVLVNAAPEKVVEEARRCIQKNGTGKGIILSAGGGTSPGTPKENIMALLEAASGIQ